MLINKQGHNITENLKIGSKTVKAVYFHKPEEPYGFLSNWHLSNFVLDGMGFTSAEQYIMYRKCKVFGDDASARRILETDDTAKQQDIAHYAKGYNDLVWNGIRQVAAMRAIYAKFSQNEELRQALLDTQDSYLVECAKSDKIWACGISLYDNRRFDIDNWQGKNILGFALMEVRNMLKKACESDKNNKITLIKDDITRLDCDCIVNAANNSLLGGGGVDGAIHRAAGRQLLEECKTLHGCGTGEAKITKGYNLKAKHIIHTVGPVYSGKREDEALLSSCYLNSLNLARENNIHSIAFPSISTGVYGYPVKKAVPVALRTVKNWLNSNRGYDISVIICCFDDNTYSVYREALNACE